MKDIRKYKNTHTTIKVNSEEEYDALVPLLNTIFTGWMKGKWNDYRDERSHFYIHLYSDSVSRDHYDYEIIEAEELLKPEVVNNYQIY